MPKMHGSCASTTSTATEPRRILSACASTRLSRSSSLNHYIVPGGNCLTWEHVEDAPGKLCPNPRVILPRRMIEDILDGPQRVDVRSFGVRCPPTHRESRLYGILAMIHVLSPALAWLWRLVAPRGHSNPSIQTQHGVEMQSEGVGSYWAFATGRRVDQANLLLHQILDTPETRYVLAAQPIYWRVEGWFHGGVDRARISCPSRQRQVCPRAGG